MWVRGGWNGDHTVVAHGRQQRGRGQRLCTEEGAREGMTDRQIDRQI